MFAHDISTIRYVRCTDVKLICEFPRAEIFLIISVPLCVTYHIADISRRRHFQRYSERRTKKSELCDSSLRFTKGGREGCPELKYVKLQDIGKVSFAAQNYLSTPAEKPRGKHLNQSEISASAEIHLHFAAGKSSFRVSGSSFGASRSSFRRRRISFSTLSSFCQTFRTFYHFVRKIFLALFNREC